MRIFVALDIEDAIRQRIQRFMDGVSEFAPEARWVRPESLHVTLKFIGEESPDAVEKVKEALAEVRGEPIPMVFRGHGFFPNPRSARVFWIGLEAGPPLVNLVHEVEQSLLPLDIPREEPAFSPHLTLALGGGKSGDPKRRKDDRQSRTFQRLQEKLAAPPAPEFGTMTAHEFFLYQSQLGPGGSRYTKLQTFPL